MIKYIGLAIGGLLLTACGAGGPQTSNNPLIQEAQLVGDEAPPPSQDMPSFDPSGREPPPYVDMSGPGASARGKLRQAVIRNAGTLRNYPCDAEAKQAYLAAFRDYAAAKVAMQRTQDSYEVYWRTNDDKRAVATIDDLYNSGHITKADQSKALLGGMSRLFANSEEYAEEGEIQPACRNPA